MHGAAHVRTPQYQCLQAWQAYHTGAASLDQEAQVLGKAVQV